MEEEIKLLTVSEMAEFLRVPRSWIYARTKQKGPNSIPRVQCGKYIRFHVTEVLEWLQSIQADGQIWPVRNSAGQRARHRRYFVGR